MSDGEKTSQTQAESLLADTGLSVDQKLIEEGTAQLKNEIKVLESWLRELDVLDDPDAEKTATRKSYSDMLQSRKQMLSTLARQSKLRAVAN